MKNKWAKNEKLNGEENNSMENDEEDDKKRVASW